MAYLLRRLGAVLLLLLILLAVAVVVVPRFLDRIYYRGPVSGHFDGARFANPDGDEDTGRTPGGGSRAGFFWRYLTGSDDRPPWPTQVLVRPASAAELAPLSSAETTPMRATWIGHASVLVQAPGLSILTDPVWAERSGPFGFGPKRVAAPGIALADLPHVDLILISHNHYDHLDLATLKRLWDRDHPQIVTSLGNDAILRAHGIQAVAVDWGRVVPVGGRPGVGVAVTRNHHWGSRWFTDRNRALWSSFVVTLPGGNLFFAGDTGFGDGEWPREARRLGPIRLALIPIGAFRFTPGQMASGAHIGPLHAVSVFDRLGAQTAIPIHWGTFRLSYEAYRTPPRLLAAAMRCSGITDRRFADVRIGRPVAIPPLSGTPSAETAKADPAALSRCLDTPAVHGLG